MPRKYFFRTYPGYTETKKGKKTEARKKSSPERIHAIPVARPIEKFLGEKRKKGEVVKDKAKNKREKVHS